MILAVPLRKRWSLGAEELIELGRSQVPLAQAQMPVAQAPMPTVPPASARTVALQPAEGRLFVKVAEDIIAFAKDFSTAIEFHSYCPAERWQTSLTRIGTWMKEIERQLRAGQSAISVPADAVFHLMDLEECVSAAKDARISAAKLAFTISAVGAIADTVFGLSWLGIPAYIAGLAILYGRPLLAKLQAEPQEPFKPDISGHKMSSACVRSTSSFFRLGDHTDKRKILERVILSTSEGVQQYHWGEARPAFGGLPGAVCLAKGRFRVRAEGWAGDDVRPAAGWAPAPIGECDSRREIVVWSPCGTRSRGTPYGPVPAASGFEETFWVEYVGPLTGGTCRVAGPFG